MNKVVEVRLWGTTIGYLGYAPGQTEVATFEYDEKILRSGIQISPLKMKYPPDIYTLEKISRRTFNGLPGIFADSLPDKYGNQLIDMYFAKKGIPDSEITALDRLLYVGTRGMGALEYQPAESIDDKDEYQGELDIHKLAELAELVILNKKKLHQSLLEADSRSMALKLIRVGSSAGGARSKALVALSPEGKIFDGTISHGPEYTYWVLKFDHSANTDRDSSDPKGMPKVEYIYSNIARICNIDIPETKYIEDGDDFHFLIERFDRKSEDDKINKSHYASWAGLAHADRDTTGAYSYEQLILAMRELGLGQTAITEQYKRTIFNIIGRNQDDHTKNFGFLMNKKGEWSLSPAFDLTYSFDPNGKRTKAHQIALNRKQDGFDRNDLLEFGRYCNLNKNQANKIITTTIQAFRGFKHYAKEFKIGPSLDETIQNSLRLDL